MSKFADLSVLDPEFKEKFEANLKLQEALAVLPTDPQERLALIRHEAATTWVSQAQLAYGSQLPDNSLYRISEHNVPVDQGEIRLRACIPVSDQDKKFPLLMYFHGGGWITGNIETADYQLRIIAVMHQVVTVNVDYRLAPEHPFPTPMDDCFAAVKWASSHTEALSVDLQKGFVVMGSSAGAHLATVSARRARDDPPDGKPIITGQLLQVPATCHPGAYPERFKGQLLSMEQNADGPGLTRDAMLAAWGLLRCPPEHIDASPLLAPLAGMPKTFLQISGSDPLRDEGLLYEKLLREAGVETKHAIYPGLPHSFETEYYMIGAAKKHNDDLHNGIRWLLGKV